MWTRISYAISTEQPHDQYGGGVQYGSVNHQYRRGVQYKTNKTFQVVVGGCIYLGE